MEMAVRVVVLGLRWGGEGEMKRGWRGRRRAHGEAQPGAVPIVVLGLRRGGEGEMKRGGRVRRRAHGEAQPGADLSVSGTKATAPSTSVRPPRMAAKKFVVRSEYTDN